MTLPPPNLILFCAFSKFKADSGVLQTNFPHKNKKIKITLNTKNNHFYITFGHFNHALEHHIFFGMLLGFSFFFVREYDIFILNYKCFLLYCMK
jgi:hypothetical protein